MRIKHYHSFVWALLLQAAQLSAQTTLYVHPQANGQNNGSSWLNAYRDLHTALQAAQKGDAIWVAEGIYRPSATNDRKAFFMLKSGVRLYGGFAGTETDPGQRQAGLHVAILDGDIGIPGDSTDNSNNILRMVNPEAGTLLDGFTLRNAVANDTLANDYEPGRSGGALYIDGRNGGGQPLIRHCIFLNNYSEYTGGAVFSGSFPAGSAKSVFEDCRFEGNRSGRRGGALFHGGGGQADARPDVLRCRFYNNRSKGNGGAFYFYDYGAKDTFRMLDCRFENNHSDNLGGAFHESGRPEGTLTKVMRCVFVDNSARIGGAFDHYSDAKISYLRIDSCLFLRNRLRKADFLLQSRYGAVMAIYSGYEGKKEETELVVNGCRFEDSDTAMAEIVLWDGSITLSNNIFTKNNYTIFTMNVISEVFIVNNRMQDNGLAIISDARKTYVLNNIVSSNKIRAIRFRPGAVVAGNIFYNIQSNFSWYTTTTSNKRITRYYNNIFVNNRNSETFEGINWQIPFTNDSSYFYNNLFSFNSCDSLPSLMFCQTGNLYATDPMFVNPAAGDFRLQPCSPAIDAGLNLPYEELSVTSDFSGRARIAEGQADIGPYGHQGMLVSGAPLVSPACPGQANGKLDFRLEGGCEPYQYAWKHEQGTGTGVTGLPRGVYIFTITDSRGRVLIQTAAISEAPPPVVLDSVMAASCASCSDGAILPEYRSGLFPLTFRWSTGDTTPVLRHLKPGIYTLSITDGAGCQHIRTYTLSYASGTGEVSWAAANLQVYPNPASGRVVVALPPQAASQSGILTVTDARGQLVYRRTCSGQGAQQEIAVAHWASGLYVCRFTQDRRNWAATLVVKGE